MRGEVTEFIKTSNIQHRTPNFERHMGAGCIQSSLFDVFQTMAGYWFFRVGRSSARLVALAAFAL
jgi:hypothetical protein